MAHFVWLLDTEIRYDIEILSIDRWYWIRIIFIKKSCRKFAPKTSPRPLFYFVKQPKTAIVRNLLKVRYFERGLSKTFKKANFIFSFEPSPF